MLETLEAWRARALDAFALVSVPDWGQFITHPGTRMVGLTLLVYATIRAIAMVYSGDMQNSEIGPIGIRPHAAQKLNRKTMLLPRMLMPMNMDGVSAKCRIFYAYTDPKGRRRRQLIHTLDHAQLAVSPVKLPRVTTAIYGQEVPDLDTVDVCFPPLELEKTPDVIEATPAKARDYVALHHILESWKEDDDALLISLHKDVQDDINAARMSFIQSEANKVRAAREGNWIKRLGHKRLNDRRPNVIGSLFIKIEFSHDPWFVLTRHPDRDLKMTAWLTVLTSMFSLVMDAWPERASPRDGLQSRSEHSTARPAARRP